MRVEGHMCQASTFCLKSLRRVKSLLHQKWDPSCHFIQTFGPPSPFSSVYFHYHRCLSVSGWVTESLSTTSEIPALLCSMPLISKRSCITLQMLGWWSFTHLGAVIASTLLLLSSRLRKTSKSGVMSSLWGLSTALKMRTCLSAGTMTSWDIQA